jgi:hypothetical protein
MNTKLTVRIETNYGNRVIYPVCETSEKLANLIGTLTLTEGAISKLKDLGFTFEVQQQTL